MHFKHYENPYSRLAQYVNCAAANSGADAGMYDASSEIYKLSTETIRTYSRSQIEVGEKVIPDLLNKHIVIYSGTT